MPAGFARSAKTASGMIQASTSIVASLSTIESRLPMPSPWKASSLARVTQPTVIAGSAITMAKNEVQKPSAEMSRKRSPSFLPAMRRAAPESDC